MAGLMSPDVWRVKDDPTKTYEETPLSRGDYDMTSRLWSAMFPGSPVNPLIGQEQVPMREPVQYVPGQGLMAQAMTQEGFSESLDMAMNGPLALGMVDDAARAANFAKWFGKSKVVDGAGKPLEVYHGTAAGPIEAFEHRKGLRTSGPFGAEREVEGGAFFFTPSKQLAGEFASNRSGSKAYGNSPSVIPANLKLENPLDLTKKNAKTAKVLEQAGFDIPGTFGYKAGWKKVQDFKKWDDKVAEITKQIEKSPSDEYLQGQLEWAAGMRTEALESAKPYLKQANYNYSASDLWAVADNPEVVSKLREMGYDGLIISEKDAAKNLGAGNDAGVSYAVFEPTQIKSTKNRGTYDPANPNIFYSAIPVGLMGYGVGEE